MFAALPRSPIIIAYPEVPSGRSNNRGQEGFQGVAAFPANSDQTCPVDQARRPQTEPRADNLTACLKAGMSVRKGSPLRLTESRQLLMSGWVRVPSAWTPPDRISDPTVGVWKWLLTV